MGGCAPRNVGFVRDQESETAGDRWVGGNYRPSMGVTSSMLLGREYAVGLREGSGRSALVP